MKKAMAFLLVLALALGVGAACAEEEPVAMRIVECPEQGFSTLCKPDYDYSFTPDGGITIELGPETGDPWVSIFKTDAPGADFDAENYLTNVYRQMIAGSADQIVNDGEYSVFTLGGKEMPGIMVMYLAEGEGRWRFCAYDLQGDYFVRYEASSKADDAAMEQALTALAVAAGNFQPDASYYANR